MPDTNAPAAAGSTTGYMHPGYAQSLSEFGTPTELKQSRAWFLRRRIPGSAYFDGMCCYPYLTCQDWSLLASDLEAHRHDLVSFVATPDPFGSYTSGRPGARISCWGRSFQGTSRRRSWRRRDEIVSRRHRKEAERALRQLNVECHQQPLQFLDDWMRLFELAVKKFRINGHPRLLSRIVRPAIGAARLVHDLGALARVRQSPPTSGWCMVALHMRTPLPQPMSQERWGRLPHCTTRNLNILPTESDGLIGVERLVLPRTER